MRLIAIFLGVTFLVPGVETTHARSVDKCSLRHHTKCKDANLRGKKLRGVVLHHADLRGANLDYADLRGANLEHADLRGASLRHANLRGARLRGTRLHHRHSQQVVHTQATPNCSPVCQGADLSYSDLTNAQLTGANLSYANLTSTNLTNAELRSANVAFAVLTGATLTGADFTGTTNCATTAPTGILDGEGCADDTSPVCYFFSSYSAATGIFTVSANYFAQTATYAVPDNDTQITSLSVQAWVVETGITITSSQRTFTASFSGATNGTFSQSLSGSQTPWTTSSGTTPQTRTWDVTDTGYGIAGGGRIRVTGGGGIQTWTTNPDQRIRVVIQITGTTRTAEPCA